LRSKQDLLAAWPRVQQVGRVKTFIDDDFLLNSEPAKKLYHEYAKDEPILDYHCHLPPDQISSNHQFSDLYEIWLAGDHYKWRAMRTNGIDEKLCTGSAEPREKFLAFAKTVPKALRNPIYHWTHLELLRYFEIDDLLDESTAPAIWDRANELLSTSDFRVQPLLERSKVRAVCTTDDPTDDLSHHTSHNGTVKLFPTFRPDKSMQVQNAGSFRKWVEDLEEVSGIDCAKFDGFLDALKQRHTFFHQAGCRLSDHGLTALPLEYGTEKKARRIYTAALAGEDAEANEWEAFASFMMLYFGHLDKHRGWTKQLHLGAMRNNSAQRLKRLGPDTGFDSIGDYPQAEALSKYLDALEQEDALPQTVLYNLNPADNYVFGTMIGNFQQGPAAGKIQFGSGWWFLDQKEAMEWQMNALSNLGLLSRFVGMLTDSRSFLSYSRHEYFRRVLCNLVGADIEKRELPDDYDLVGGMVRDICFRNAAEFFKLEI